MTETSRKANLEFGVQNNTKAGLSEIKQDVVSVGDVAAQASAKAGAAFDGIGKSSDGAAAKIDKSTQVIIRSIEREVAALEAGGKSTAAYYESIAKQRGADMNAIGPYLQQMRLAEKQAQQAMGTMEISAKQTAAAMRGVPAQFTDIFVSLQGGQAPLTVFLQQGGQLKDMFGSAGNAAKALGSYVLGLVNPYTVAGAAVVALGAAYYQGSKEQDAFVKAIVLTGNASGMTTSQLHEYARQIDAVIGTQAQAAAGLAAFTAAGVQGGDELRRYTQTAIEWERATGQAVEKTAEQFASLQKDPLAAVLKLNEGTNFLTTSVYEQIKSLEEQGKKTEAAEVAMNALDASMRERAKAIEESLGYIERGWRGITSAAKEAWDAILNVGRPETKGDQLSRIQTLIANKEQGLDSYRNTRAGKIVEAEIEALRQQEWALQGVINEEQSNAAAKAESARQTQVLIDFDKKWSKALEGEKTLQDKLTAARNEAVAAGKSDADIKTVLAFVTEEHNKGLKKAKDGTKAYNRELDQQKSLMGELSGLSSNFHKDWEHLNKAYARGALSLAELEKAQAALLAKQPFAVALAKEEAEATKARVKAYEEEVKAQDKLLQQRQDAAQKAQEAVQKARDEEEAYAYAAAAGITLAEAVAHIALARAEDNYQKGLAQGLDGQTLLALQQERDARRELIDVMAQKGVREANKKAQDEITNDWEKLSQTVGRTLADYIMGGGKDAATYLKRLFATLVLEPIVQTAVGSLLGQGGATSNAGGSAGGLGGAGNLLSTGKSIYSAIQSPIFSDFGLGLGMNATSAGELLFKKGFETAGTQLMDLGTVLAKNADAINIAGDALGYANAIYSLSKGKYGTAAGAAIGTYFGGPIGGAIGSTLGGLVDSLFGGDDIPRYAASAEYRGGVTSKGWTPDDQWNDALYPMVNGLAGAIGSALDATAKTFGKTAGYELSTTFSKDAENNGIFGTLNIIGPDGKSLADWSKYDKDWGGRWFSDGDAGTKEFMAAITADVKSAFLTIDLPGWSTQLINAAENIDGINAALQQIGTIKAVFDSLGQTMEMFAGISGDLQTRLLHAAGSIDALTNAVGAFYQGFYSEQERMDSLAEQLRVSLRSLGSSIDPSIGEHAKVEFRDAVRGAMESGQVELAYQLMAMSSSFATASEYAQKAATTAAEAAAEALQKARDTAIDNAWANVQAALDREKSYWSGIASASQAAIGSLTSTLGLLTSNARELYGTVDSTQQMLAAQGMVYIENALAAVAGGASVADYSGLQDAITAARGGISGGVYATQFDRERDALVLAGKLSELGELTDSQLTVEERQLKAAQTQIDQLDQALGYWQRQIDGTGQLIDVGLSTVDAISALAAALAAREQAKIQPQKGPAAGGALDGPYQYGGGNSFLDGVIDYGNQYGSDAYYFIPGVNDYAAKQQSINDIAAITGQSASDLWGSMFGGLGADYWQAVQNASNAGAVVNASDSLDDILRKAGVPGYAVGANYIPNDQLAFLHKGEAVVPAPFNPWAGGMQRMLSGNGMGGNTERLEQLVEKVAVELQRLQTIVGEGNRAQSDLLDITDQKSEGGSADRVRITNVQELAVAIKEVMA